VRKQINKARRQAELPGKVRAAQALLVQHGSRRRLIHTQPVPGWVSQPELPFRSARTRNPRHKPLVFRALFCD
jgi:hypothetical protein